MDRQSENSSLENHIKMVANVYDAHTAALFIQQPHSNILELVAKESLSRQIVPDCIIRPGEGLLGWVARENRRLHITRFDRDTRTLGIYAKDVDIKALLAAPLPEGRGVLMVDSRNRHAFPEKKQKILEDFAAVARDLWNVHKCRIELDFYRSLTDILLKTHLTTREYLVNIAKLLGMDTVVMSVMLHGQKKYSVEMVWRKGIRSDRWAGKIFDIEQGYTGWFFRKGMNLLMKDFKGDAQKSFLIGEDDLLTRGEVLAGIISSAGKRYRVIIFTGPNHISNWPDRLLDLTARAIDLHLGAVQK